MVPSCTSYLVWNGVILHELPSLEWCTHISLFTLNRFCNECVAEKMFGSPVIKWMPIYLKAEDPLRAKEVIQVILLTLMENQASDEHSRMSHAVIMSTPPPIHAEWMAAITGLGHCRGGRGGEGEEGRKGRKLCPYYSRNSLEIILTFSIAVKESCKGLTIFLIWKAFLATSLSSSLKGWNRVPASWRSSPVCVCVRVILWITVAC